MKEVGRIQEDHCEKTVGVRVRGSDSILELTRINITFLNINRLFKCNKPLDYSFFLFHSVLLDLVNVWESY